MGDESDSWWSQQSSAVRVAVILAGLLIVGNLLMAGLVLSGASVDVFSFGNDGDTVGPETAEKPVINFAYSYDAANGTLTISHVGGDDPPANSLRIAGRDWETAWGNSSAHVQPGSQFVVRGVEAGETVTVSWKSPVTGVSVVIDTYDVPPEPTTT